MNEREAFSRGAETLRDLFARLTPKWLDLIRSQKQIRSADELGLRF